jgi:hypothetical protein
VDSGAVAEAQDRIVGASAVAATAIAIKRLGTADAAPAAGIPVVVTRVNADAAPRGAARDPVENRAPLNDTHLTKRVRRPPSGFGLAGVQFIREAQPPVGFSLSHFLRSPTS